MSYPFTKENIRGLKVDDLILISGIMFTTRGMGCGRE